MLPIGAMVDSARETALKILYDIEEKGAYTKIAFNRCIRSSALDARDKAFVTELVFGTVRMKLKIDWIIRQFSNTPMEKISPWVLNILRLGVFQLVFTDRIPSSAAVNESVRLSKKYGHRAVSGFVNGVLRNIDRKKDKLSFPDRNENVVEHLSVVYSHPHWLVKRWLERYGPDFTEGLLRSNNEKPVFSIRVNTIINNRETLSGLLEGKGYRIRQGRYLPEALIVLNPLGLLNTEEYREGRFVVQDEAAMMVSRVLDPEPGENVIDLCSAPGGKATHIAQIMHNKGIVHAWDIYGHKLKLLNDNIKRTGSEIVRTARRDASVVCEEYMECADRVLADVPCTGLGIIRRKPDIKWTRKENDLSDIVVLQQNILRTAAGYLKPGGVLVYSTCTVEPEENEGVVWQFAEENPRYHIESVMPYTPKELQDAVSEDGMLRLFPNVNSVDGFFVARIRKRD